MEQQVDSRADDYGRALKEFGVLAREARITIPQVAPVLRGIQELEAREKAISGSSDMREDDRKSEIKNLRQRSARLYIKLGDILASEVRLEDLSPELQKAVLRVRSLKQKLAGHLLNEASFDPDQGTTFKGTRFAGLSWGVIGVILILEVVLIIAIVSVSSRDTIAEVLGADSSRDAQSTVGSNGDEERPRSADGVLNSEPSQSVSQPTEGRSESLGAEANAGAARRVYVNERSKGSSSGETWENACTTLSGAIALAAAANVSEIWVAKGVYSGSIRIPANTTVVFGFTGMETDAREAKHRIARAFFEAPATGTSTIQVDAGAEVRGLWIGGMLRAVGASGGPAILVVESMKGDASIVVSPDQILLRGKVALSFYRIDEGIFRERWISDGSMSLGNFTPLTREYLSGLP